MYLGLDLGTTNIKAVVVNNDGAVVVSASAPVEIFYLNDGGVEQDIEQIWSATLSAINHAVQSGIGSQIQAIGVSSQGGAIQVQAQDRKPVGPVISWMDGRGISYDDNLTRKLGGDWFAAHTGHGMSAVSPGQILRLMEQKQLPEGFRVGYVGDVIVSRLCGRAGHDATSLSLAMLYNPAIGKADPELLEEIGLNENQLPDLHHASEPAGGVLDTVAELTHVPAGIPVSAAIHDQYAAAIGCGAVNPGDVMFGAGTAWVLLAVTDKLSGPVVDSAFECTHIVEGLYGQILSMVNGGSSLSWMLKILGVDGLKSDQIDEMIEAVSPGCDGLKFWPLLTQSGTGGMPGGVAGQLAGMKMSHTKAHLVRAVIEGLACELARHLIIMAESGVNIKRLIMAGHAASSRVTPKIVADITRIPIACIQEAAVSAVGAAAIARTLVDTDECLVDISRRYVTSSRMFEPSNMTAPVYHTLLKDYLAPFNIHE